jgi:nucleotide-binding universal stress UspA family protein
MAHPSSFRTILVPLDGSPLAEQALPLAGRIAETAGSKVRLALVHETPAPPLDPVAARLFMSAYASSTKVERSYLRSIQARMRQDGVRLASAVTLRGPVAPTIEQYVRELGIDLVVMATHGRGGVRRAWLGSVADHLVRHLEIPVLLVRPGEDGAAIRSEPGAYQILVPVDGSPLAEEAIAPAVDLARLWGLEVKLLQVVHPVLFWGDELLGWPAPQDQALTEQARSQAEGYVRDLAERLRRDGIRATGAAIIGGSAADTILQVANPERVAAIAIATHGRGGLRRLVLGSVADKLIRATAIPVLVHHPRQRPKAKPRRGPARAGSATPSR